MAEFKVAVDVLDVIDEDTATVDDLVYLMQNLFPKESLERQTRIAACLKECDMEVGHEIRALHSKIVNMRIDAKRPRAALMRLRFLLHISAIQMLSEMCDDLLAVNVLTFPEK